jgi:putative PEP-CTERM system TPR-repeat lipoprotein
MYFGWNSMLLRRLTQTVLLSILLLSGCGEDLTDAQYVERARESQDKGELRKSIIDLKNALQKNPANAEARSLLGQIYTEFGDGDSAEKELRRALEQGAVIESLAEPLAKALLLQGKFADLLAINVDTSQLNEDTKARLFTLRGRAYLGQGNVDEAAKQLQLALAAQPTSPAALLGQAMLAFRQQQWDEARRWNDQALAVAPNSAEAWSLQGDLERQAGEYSKAEEAYTKAIQNHLNNWQDFFKRALVRIELKNYEGAQKDVDILKRMAPHYGGNHYAQGRIHLDQRHLAEAQTAFEQALNSNGHDPEALYYLGLTHLAQNHFQQAGEYLSQLLSLQPQSDQVAKLLVQIYIRNSELAKAEAILKPVLQTTPHDPEAISLMGRIFMLRGDSKQGVEYLQRTVNLQPDTANTRLQLGLSLLEKGDQESGVKELQKAMALNPQLQQADLALITSYLRTREFDKALEAATNLVNKQPGDPLTHHFLGVVYMSRGEDKKARDEFEQSLKLQPNFAGSEINLAQLDAKAGNRSAAETRYQRILAKNDSHLGAMLGLSRLAQQSGQMDQAVTWLEKAWEKNPDSPEAALALFQEYLDSDQAKALSLARNLHTAKPDNPIFLQALGIALLTNDDTAEALVNFRRLTELRPQSPMGWHWLALTQIKTQDYKNAAGSVDKALAAQSDYLPALVTKAELQINAKRFDEALKSVHNLQARYPAESAGYTLEGHIYRQQQNFAKAAVAYQAAYDKTPDGSLALALSDAQYQSGNQEAALHTLRHWLAVAPEDAQVRTQLVSYLQRLNRTAEAVTERSRLAQQGPAAGDQNTEQGPTPSELEAVRKSLQDKDYAQAGEAASRLIARFPKDPGLHNLLGVVYLNQSKDAAARSEFQQALQLQPNYVTALLNLAQLDLKAGNKEAAAERYRQILKQDEGQLVALLGLASLAEQDGRPEEALSWLEKAWEKNPTSIQTGVGLVNQYLLRNQNRKALELAERIHGAYPDDPAAVLTLGRVQMVNGDTTNALANFRRLTELQPQSPEAWQWWAIAQGVAKDYQGAMAAMDKALALKSDYLPSLLAKVELQQRMGHPAEALEGARNLETRFPAESSVYKLEGDIQIQQQNFAKAAAAYQTAYDKSPTGQAALALSEAQRLAGDQEAALGTLRKRLATAPNEASVRLALAMYLEQLNRPTEAIPEYEQVLKQNPNNAIALNNLALLYNKQGDARSLKYAEQAAKLAPEQPQINDTLGWLLVQNGQVQRGLTVLEQAAQKAPNELDIRYHLAVAYAKAGRSAEARAELNKLLGEGKTFNGIDEARALLDKLQKSP